MLTFLGKIVSDEEHRRVHQGLNRNLYLSPAAFAGKCGLAYKFRYLYVSGCLTTHSSKAYNSPYQESLQ